MSDNDTQYGNLLLLDAELPKGMPDHHRVSPLSLVGFAAELLVYCHRL